MAAAVLVVVAVAAVGTGDQEVVIGMDTGTGGTR
jgi:hypothetical protein